MLLLNIGSELTNVFKNIQSALKIWIKRRLKSNAQGRISPTKSNAQGRISPTLD